MQIEFEVDGQRLIRTSDAYMISGSENFVECVFDFSNDWETLDKWAVFIQGEDIYKISIVNNTCLIPIECTAIEGEFTIHVVGCKDAENIIATTNEKLLTVRPSIFFPAIKSYIQKIIEYIKSLKQDTESIKQGAEQAKQEAQQAKQEAQQAKQEAQQAKEEVDLQAKYVDNKIKENAFLVNNIVVVNGKICMLVKKGQ